MPKKPMPKKLQDDLKNSEMRPKVQQDALAAKQKELGEINAQNTTRTSARYLELTGRSARPQRLREP